MSAPGWVVEQSLQNRVVVTLAVVLLVLLGAQSFRTLPIDAVPDVTNVQVQVLTNAPGLSPLETEQLVSRPVELAMAGIPGSRVIRSISRAGVCAVTIVFDDDVELARRYHRRPLVPKWDHSPPGSARSSISP